MNRREFLKSLCGAVAVMAVPGLTGGKALAEPHSVSFSVDGLMKGEFGRLDGGIRFVETPTEDEMLDAIVKAAEVLDAANVPKNGRFVKVNEYLSEKLLEDLYLTTNPPIVSDNGFGVGVVARPHMIKPQHDMNRLLRSMVVDS